MIDFAFYRHPYLRTHMITSYFINFINGRQNCQKLEMRLGQNSTSIEVSKIGENSYVRKILH